MQLLAFQGAVTVDMVGCDINAQVVLKVVLSCKCYHIGGAKVAPLDDPKLLTTPGTSSPPNT